MKRTFEYYELNLTPGRHVDGTKMFFAFDAQLNDYGGEQTIEIVSDVEVFNVDTNSWDKVPEPLALAVEATLTPEHFAQW